MGLHRVMSMRVGVPDPEGLGGFYDELGLERPRSGAYTGTDGGAEVLVEQYPFRRLLEVTVGAADQADLDATVARLTERGLSASFHDGDVVVVEPATKVTFRVQVAAPYEPPAAAVHPPRVPENAPGHVVRRNTRAPGVFDGPRPPRRLGHLVVGTPDLAGTTTFLVDGLGFRMSDDMSPIMAFLRCSTDHHNVAIVDSPVPLLQHYSWECDDVDHVGHAATALVRADPTRHAWGFGRHYLGSNYYWYLNDPSGAFLELYSDMDVIDDDEAWERAGRTPVGFEHVANSWGPNLPAEFIVPTDIDVLQAAWAAKD